MPQPTSGDVHVSRPLTRISIAHMQAQSNFVADRVFPVVPSDKQLDTYFEFPRGAFNRDDMKKRAEATAAPTAGYDIITQSFRCDVWALAHDISDERRANSDQPLNQDRNAAQFLTMKGLINRERQWVSAFFKTGVWTRDVTGVSGTPTSGQFKQFNDAASIPIEVFTAEITRIHKLTGFRPNKLTLGREVWDVLKNHPDFIDRVKAGQTSGPAMVQRATLAQILEIEEVLVMDAVYNTAGEGVASNHDFIGGKAALLAYAPSSPGVEMPTAGYTFAWTGLLGTSANGIRINRMRLDKEHADRIEIQSAYQQKKVSADLGTYFATAVA